MERMLNVTNKRISLVDVMQERVKEKIQGLIKIADNVKLTDDA
jgi:hypothetical protein